MQESPYFNILKFDLRNLSIHTELLESCDWDEEELEKILQIIDNFMQCFFLPPPLSSFQSFDSWINEHVGNELQTLGLSKEQARIACDLIINRKEEFLTLVNLEEN